MTSPSKRVLLAAAAVAIAVVIWLWRDGSESAAPISEGGAERGSSGSDLEGPTLGSDPSFADRIRSALDKQRGAAGEAVSASLGRLEGVVVDQDGARVEGVDVLFRNQSGELTATSDGSGEFELELGRGTYQVRAIGDGVIGVAIPAVQVTSSDSPTEIEVVVQRLATLRGRLVDRGGESLRGASVHVVPGSRAERNMARGGLLLDQVAVESGGGFEIQVLPKKQLLLEGRAGHRRARLAVNDLAPGETRDGLILSLPAGVEVSGVVLDPAGRVVPGAEVILKAAVGGLAHDQLVETDDGGRFAFEPMTRGALSVEARGRGHAPSAPVVIEPDNIRGRYLDLTLQLQRSESLAGVVVDQNGNGVGGVRIRVGRGGSSFGAQEEYTDESGRFEVVGLDRGKHWLSAVKGGFATTTKENLEPPEDELELTLLPYGAIRGAVTDRTGRALSSFVVTIDRVKQRGVSVPKPIGKATRFSGGQYELDDLEPGRYDLTVSASGRAPAKLSVEVPPGDVGNGSAVLGEP